MTDRELIAECKRWAEYLRPVIEDDNAWYGKQWLDGKDAGEIGELLQAVATIGDRLLPDLPDWVDAVLIELHPNHDAATTWDEVVPRVTLSGDTLEQALSTLPDALAALGAGQ